MSKFVKLGALALSAIALSCNVSATEQSAKDSLQNSLLSYMAAVKDSSSLTVYSAVEFEGLDPQTNCYTPNDYSNYPELDPSLNAEICYEGILSPEDGTKYIAYSDSKGYQVVFKDNLINHVIIPVGAEGKFNTASSIKLRVSQANKTPNSQTLYCEDNYNQAVRCNGAYVVVAAKEQQTDMNQALDSLYASLAQVASTSLGPQVTDALNKAEDAYSKAADSQLTADKAAIDASSALSKIASAESDLNAKIANNKTLAAGASSTAGSALSKANANSAELSTLSKSVNDNKVAIGTKVDSSYVDTAIANQNLPDFASLVARLEAQEQKIDTLVASNQSLEDKNLELSKKVPIASIVFDGGSCPNSVCPILSGYGISKVLEFENEVGVYRLFFDTPLNDANYAVSAYTEWERDTGQAWGLHGYNMYPKTKESVVVLGFSHHSAPNRKTGKTHITIYKH
jgi:hypothetical protein